MAKIIKRYENRKLYDMEESTYVTLNEIADMIKRGEDVKVIDNKTKEDLTAITLTQIILEEEKQKKGILPLAFLKNIIQQSGESISEFVQRVTPQATVSAVKDAVEDAEKGIMKFLEKGEETIEEGKEMVRDLIKSPAVRMEVIQKKIDERLRVALEKLPGVSQYYTHIKELENKVASLEAELARKNRDLRRRTAKKEPPLPPKPKD